MATQTAEKTVVGLFDDMADAQSGVNALERAGISRNNINVVAGNEGGRYDKYYDKDAGDVAARGAGKGAATGAAIGGGLGLIAGLSALAIPGFGPIIAAGPIAAALTGAGIGAATGGLIGALASAGVPREDAEFYAEGVRRGGVLVIVRVDDRLADDVAKILDDAGARDVDEKSNEWRRSGWSGPTTTGTGTTMGSTGVQRGTMESGREIPVEVRRRVRVFSGMGEPITSDYTTDFRSDFDRRYQGRNLRYEQYQPAYEFGYRYAGDERYRGQDWTMVEPSLRRDWESRGQGAWEDFKDSIRYGWDKVRGRR